ncbi:hypothetical protein BEWA_010220 [Theileria equi strain WA]|uniref:RRM domain-containing protein n=1 Tax=Theileria equi strain WA TaxID=1537102 RepID=L0B286_THEEQ|nr:hypothetical protein BEWA_010220 [Theileria equi strain WA]AFZ81608.1 hypothetical protein BEWA_010220 [Theileria equi strain WA]|eukprot:XP_004831274.1 hypothetical protein BEWA_010220 [Theileria equi strain WA]
MARSKAKSHKTEKETSTTLQNKTTKSDIAEKGSRKKDDIANKFEQYESKDADYSIAKDKGDCMNSKLSTTQILPANDTNINKNERHVKERSFSTADDATPNAPDSTLKFFVGGLHPNCDEAELSNYFSKYGQIVTSQVMRDFMTGRHRGFGFVTLKIQSNTMDVFKDSHILTGKRVDVRTMQTDTAAGLRKKIFVGGLSKALNEEMLEEYFSKFGEIEKVTIMRQLDGTSRGFGFILFVAENSAENALKSPSHFVYGNKVDVRAAETRPKLNSMRGQDSAYSLGMMQTPTSDVYPSVYSQMSKDYSNFYKQGAYDPQYAQQQILQQYAQQQLLQQQMVQHQLAMANSYEGYYNSGGQVAPAYTQDSSKYPSMYGAYRGKTDSSYQSGATYTGTSNLKSYRQEPY